LVDIKVFSSNLLQFRIYYSLVNMKQGITKRTPRVERSLAEVRGVHKELNDRVGLIDFEGAGYIPESAHSFLTGIDQLEAQVVTDPLSLVWMAQMLDHLDEFEQSALSDPYRASAGRASLEERLGEVEVPETNHWFIGPID
jgi:hypothetical protein